MSVPTMTNHRGILRRRGGEVVKRLEGLVAPIGVEVGVFRGALAACVLTELPTLTWHMVDPWCEPSKDGSYYRSGDSVSRLTAEEFREVYEDCRQRVAFAANRAVEHAAYSLDACKEFDDASVDLVFIDADHSYVAVSDDVAAWFRKVRPGGWIGGHDWRPPDSDTGWNVEPGVRSGLHRCGIEAADIELGVDKTWWYRVSGGGA